MPTTYQGLRLFIRARFLKARVAVHLGAHRIAYILAEDKMHFVRLILALSSLTWAAVLYNSDLFNQGLITYRVMSSIMSAEWWAFWFMLSGIACLSSVALNLRNRFTLLCDALLTCLLWTSSTLACLAAWWPHETTGWFSQMLAYQAPVSMAGELWLTVAAWWHFVRQATDRRVWCRGRCPSCPYAYINEEDRHV